MNVAIEVVTVPVRDVDRAVVFYAQTVGFHLDVDYAPTPDFRVVQVTPPGSACSIQFGIGLTTAEPGSLSGVYLVVPDLQASREQLIREGVDVTEIRHKSPLPEWLGGWAPGLEPERTNYSSFADFSDPDGNRWTLQERRG